MKELDSSSSSEYNIVLISFIPTQHKFTLLLIKDVMKKVETEVKDILNDIKEMSTADRIEKLNQLRDTFKEALTHGEEKVAMAIQTYDLVRIRFF